MPTSEFDFSDLILRQEDVVGPNKKKYVLREATGAAARQFQNARMNRVIIGADGKPAGLKDIGDLEVMLVSLCLFEITNDGKEIRVLDKDIVQWPDRVLSKLYAKALEMSELSESENPLRDQVVAAFSHDNSPASLQQLREHVETLGDNVKDLKKLFKESTEEQAKNSQSDTTIGSE